MYEEQRRPLSSLDRVTVCIVLQSLDIPCKSFPSFQSLKIVCNFTWDSCKRSFPSVYINENYIPFSKSLKGRLCFSLLFLPRTVPFSMDRKPYVYSPARYVGTVPANSQVCVRCGFSTVSYVEKYDLL
jgi:hypothetical protein